MVASGRRKLFALMSPLVTLIVPRQTLANAFDVVGVGPESIAEVSTKVASAEDGSAAFLNPGGLAFGSNSSLVIAPTFAVSTLEAQDKPITNHDSLGITLTAAATVPFEGPLAQRLHIGFSGYFLPSAALRLVARAPDEPFYPYYDNRTQRLVAIPALGIRISKWLGVGLGANVLAGVQGPAKLEKGASGSPEPRIDIAANTVLSAIFGVRIDPSEQVHFGLVVRQSFGIPLNIETTADVGGIPLATTLLARQMMFDPLTIVLASRIRHGKFAIESNISYARWSNWEGPYMSVQSTLPGVNLVSRLPSGLFRDTMSFRLGSNYTLDTGVNKKFILRGGVAFEPSMMSGVLQGRTNLVDGHKFTVGAGATFVLQNWIGKALLVGIGGNSQFVSAFNQEKRVCAAVPCAENTVVGPDADNPSAGITNPGYPRLQASGAWIGLSLGVGVEF